MSTASMVPLVYYNPYTREVPQASWPFFPLAFQGRQKKVGRFQAHGNWECSWNLCACGWLLRCLVSSFTEIPIGINLNFVCFGLRIWDHSNGTCHFFKPLYSLFHFHFLILAWLYYPFPRPVRSTSVLLALWNAALSFGIPFNIYLYLNNALFTFSKGEPSLLYAPLIPISSLLQVYDEWRREVEAYVSY